jgi:pimeloyl-ACP methyl ester carboxylesterase
VCSSDLDDTRELAARVEGAQAIIMDGMGHFPMSEDPEGFLTYLRPVLADIDNNSGRPS